MKIVYGYLLIIFSLLFMIIIAFPQFYSTNSSGRIDKSIPLKFNFLEQESSPVVLLFFGYVGCGDICPPSMQELNNIYKQLDRTKVKVYFINILNTTNQDAPSSYVKGFNKDFIGIYLDDIGIKRVSIKLNLAIVKVNESEVGHSGHLYVLERDHNDKDYSLNYIYTTRPFAEKSIAKDINTLLQNRAKV